MRGRLMFFVGAAAGYVLGARAGRGRYEQIKAQADTLWQDPRVQDKVTSAQTFVTEAAKDTAGTVADVAKDKAAAVAEAAKDTAGSVAGVARDKVAAVAEAAKDKVSGDSAAPSVADSSPAWGPSEPELAEAGKTDAEAHEDDQAGGTPPAPKHLDA